MDTASVKLPVSAKIVRTKQEHVDWETILASVESSAKRAGSSYQSG